MQGMTPPTTDEVEASAEGSNNSGAKPGASLPREGPVLPVLAEGGENLAVNAERSPSISPHQSVPSPGDPSRLLGFGGMPP